MQRAQRRGQCRRVGGVVDDGQLVEQRLHAPAFDGVLVEEAGVEVTDALRVGTLGALRRGGLGDDVANLLFRAVGQQSKSAVYLLFEREAREKGLPVPSYRTFLSRIEKRDRREHILKRQGKRAAAQHDPWVWELEQTTPKHGDRPLEIVHMDHTELDIELVSSHTGQPLGRPWATFMTDAFSRRLLVVYLTFDPPSYRSGMMALREYVWRYGRLPQTIIVDGGADFRSTYFETLLAYYDCTQDGTWK